METRGVRVRFSSPAHENRYWWTIRECDGRYVVCVRERLALPDGLLAYTVADRRNGTRGHVKDERSGVKGACRPSDATPDAAHIDGGLTARKMTGTLPWSGRMGLLALMLLGLMWMRRGGMPRARHRA